MLLGGLLAPSSLQAKKVQAPKMYMFGFAAAFTDTIVHFTGVQELDTVWVETRNHFLLARDTYSHQLRAHLAGQQMPGRTCVVFYNTNRAKLEKQFLKMKRLYTQGKNGQAHFEVRYIDDAAFRFKSANLAADDE